MRLSKESSGIRSRIFASQLLLTLISACLFFLIFSVYTLFKSYDDTVRNMEYSANITSLHVTKFINQMESILYYISYSTQIPDVLSSREADDVFERYHNYLYITNTIPVIQSSCSFPVDIRIYAAEDNKSIYFDSYTTLSCDLIEREEWFNDMKSCGNTFYYLSETSDKSSCVFIINPIYDVTDYTRIVGYIKISADVSAFKTALDNISIIDSVNILCNKNGDIIYSSDSHNYTEHDTELMNSLENGSSPVTLRLSDKHTYRTAKKSFCNDHYMIISLYNTASIYKTNIVMLLLLSVIMLIIFAVAFLLSSHVSSSLTESIEALIYGMKKADFSSPESLPFIDFEAKENEVADAIGAYNHMLVTLKRLMKYNTDYTKQEKKYELDLLQLQIKPHFLYNTLNTIQSLAMDNRTEDISSIIRSLSQFYKFSLHNSGGLATLESEINHIRHYVEIENFKHDNAILLETDVPNDILKCRMPKITLQPIIENAINHGILEKDNACGTIVITGEKTGEDIFVYVTDDGAGIPTEKVNALKQGNVSGIGFSNTDKRLKLFFGPDCGLDIESEAGKYTKIIIKIKGDGTDDKHSDC